MDPPQWQRCRGATLSMLDAGVPLKAPVAGIAMGLIKEGDDYVVLSDILGDEDHLGDMDFKVTGTPNGITAFQMDTKIGSIPTEVMQKAMNQAREGRLHILGKKWQKPLMVLDKSFLSISSDNHYDNQPLPKSMISLVQVER